MWILIIIIFIGGSIGGTVNALISDNGFILPTKEKSVGKKILLPGFIGNCLIGGVAATVSWGLYGPFADAYLFGGDNSVAVDNLGITISGFVGAILVGIGGARWLTNEVDKTMLKEAATKAASIEKSDDLARSIATSSPSEALRAVVQKTLHP